MAATKRERAKVKRRALKRKVKIQRPAMIDHIAGLGIWDARQAASDLDTGKVFRQWLMYRVDAFEGATHIEIRSAGRAAVARIEAAREASR